MIFNMIAKGSGGGGGGSIKVDYRQCVINGSDVIAVPLDSSIFDGSEIIRITAFPTWHSSNNTVSLTSTGQYAPITGVSGYLDLADPSNYNVDRLMALINGATIPLATIQGIRAKSSLFLDGNGNVIIAITNTSAPYPTFYPGQSVNSNWKWYANIFQIA